MTDVKIFLRQIRMYRLEVIELEERIEKLHPAVYQPAIRYDIDKVQSQPVDPNDKYIDMLSDYQNKLNKYKNELMDKCRQAETMIESLTASEQRRVLRAYYLPDIHHDNKLLPTWEDVADQLGYSVQNVWVIHGKALKELNEHSKKD